MDINLVNYFSVMFSIGLHEYDIYAFLDVYAFSKFLENKHKITLIFPSCELPLYYDNNLFLSCK